MQFSVLIASLVAGAAFTVAAPTERQLPVCSGTYSNAQCCATDVLNVADLNCANRMSPFVPCPNLMLKPMTIAPTAATTGQDLIDICAAEGQQAKCCVIPIVS